MQSNRSKGTKIEVLLGRALWHAGLRYRKNDKGVPGTPDFSFRGAKTAVFCDGEFWHGRNWESAKKRIKSNQDFWYSKIERNRENDRKVTSQLRSEGWTVIRFWESDIKNHLEDCVCEIQEALGNRERSQIRSLYVKDLEMEDIAAEGEVGFGFEEE